MPIYDYKCVSCGRVFEVFSSEDHKVKCPDCGKKAERMLSAPGHVGVAKAGGGLQCGRETTCCGQAEPCAKPGCKH